ncbi:MAG: flagellar type III secretion system pore protein FliP [Pirellulales bacterium]|nr:flagellar type III secretion system pore protein FliP [Pirellulales bacterium]
MNLRLRHQFGVAACVILCCASSQSWAQQASTEPARANIQAKLDLPEALAGGPQQWTSPEGLSSSLKTMLVLGVLSLVPAVLLMTTCFVRIAVVLGLLRQALGAPQLPPAQVTTALAMFLTLLTMWPVWKQTYDIAIVPYTEQQIGGADAWQRGTQPIRRFMSAQIERTGNSDDVWMFYKYLPLQTSQPQTYDDVPLQVLLPAFLLSELKTAFLIGFQIFLPFVVLDLVVASVITAMGMMMVPPALISLPFKLLLFVLVDGWHLVVEMLMQSFQPIA